MPCTYASLRPIHLLTLLSPRIGWVSFRDRSRNWDGGESASGGSLSRNHLRASTRYKSHLSVSPPSLSCLPIDISIHVACLQHIRTSLVLCSAHADGYLEYKRILFVLTVRCVARRPGLSGNPMGCACACMQFSFYALPYNAYERSL